MKYLFLFSGSMLFALSGLAADTDHWAYQPLVRPEVPIVKAGSWQTHPIDAFIRHQLDDAGLTPATPATRQALIRRLYYDLTGLPPAPDAVERFINDAAPDAYERLVDELLASPHYGERWARHWLDVVGYAETQGYERDSDKPHIWRYRDYVINAFNNDKPYDQFIREQIAGDELPGAGPEQLIATGFYRLGIWDDEPADKLQGRYDELDGMVSTLSSTFLGSTIGCARCHDHKIDPFPAKDYYSLLAFLQGVKSTQRQSELTSVMTGEEQAAYDAGVAKKQADIARLNDAIFQVEQNFLAALNDAGGDTAGTFLRSDLVDLNYRFYRDTWERLPDFDTLRPETEGKLAHNFVTLNAASRQDAMGLVFEGKLRATEDGNHEFHVAVQGGVRLTVNGEVMLNVVNGGVRSTVGIRLWPGHHDFRVDYFNAYDVPELEISWSGPSSGKRLLSHQNPTANAPDVAKLIASRGAAVLSEAERGDYDQLKKALKATQGRHVPGHWGTTITSTGPKVADTHILLRGNPHTEGELVQPAFPGIFRAGPAVIPALDERAQSSGRRLVLANWLASPENPMTARVMMNRIWQHHFGRGIVRTSNDFGALGEAPSHPALLNWLASEFIAQDWSMKAMHRMILLSNTYRMSSEGNEKALAADPRNDHFWRFNMRRLAAEEVRDSMLAVSGSLNPKLNGPHVFPPMPAAVLATSSTPERVWGKSPEEEHTRRSIYIHVKRSLVTPLLADFDVADTDASCAVRFSTTQPTQALNLLNSEFVNGQAEILARRVDGDDTPDLRAKVGRALHLTTSRTPKNDEVDDALAFVEAMQEEHGLDEQVAFERLCLLALNLNEFMFID